MTLTPSKLWLILYIFYPFIFVSGSLDNGFWRLNLPTTIRDRQHFKRLVIDDTEVYILGTSHVSADSCDDVRILMNHLKPDVLFIELCPQRIPILFQENDDLKIDEGKLDENAGFFETMKNLQSNGMSRAGALSTILLTKVQGDYADKLGVKVGQEFKEAYECAVSQNQQAPAVPHTGVSGAGCRVVLGDRPVRLTLVRAWESLSVFGKIKLVLYLIWSSLKQPSEEELKKWMEDIMKDGDLLTASIKELSEAFPSIGRVIINERDAYMFAKLKQTASLGSRRILAVVGAGHCEGICRLVTNEKLGNQPVDTQNLLQSIIETKEWKVSNSEEMKALTTDVIELQAS